MGQKFSHFLIARSEVLGEGKKQRNRDKDENLKCGFTHSHDKTITHIYFCAISEISSI